MTSGAAFRRVSAALLVALAIGAVGFAGSAPARTVWLCRPGLHPDPCVTGLSTTVLSPRLPRLRRTQPAPDKPARIDCFYVYPTVSTQPTALANLQIDPQERSVALYQAARYSQHCRVFAPMYRQLTVSAIGGSKPLTPAELRVPFNDVSSAFNDYLEHFNHRRGFVLIGHSQGAYVLRALIVRRIDNVPSVRRRLISAILLGGNVIVRAGTGSGGDFAHVPACRRPAQLGCVIAFSTFDTAPPANSRFGRTNQPGRQVLCTNPAALSGGSAQLDSIFPTQPFPRSGMIGAGISPFTAGVKPTTAWVELAGGYVARCSMAAGASVLQITPRAGAPTLAPSPTPAWGLHLLDANIALGNLVRLIGREADAYTKAHSRRR